jgi:hypothetical protein
MGVGVVPQHRVQHGVRDLIANLVRMPPPSPTPR